MRKIGVLETALCILVVICVSVIDTLAQESDSELRNRRISIRLENRTFADVAMYLMEKYDVAIGMEFSAADFGSRHFDFTENLVPEGDFLEVFERNRAIDPKAWGVTVSFRDAPLADVMDAVVRQLKHYEWEIRDEVVNIYPKVERNQKYQELLDLKINRFRFPKGTRLSSLLNEVVALPELRQCLASNRINWSMARRVRYSDLSRSLAQDLEFQNLTLRELLNKITRIKRGGWILTRRTGQADDKEIETIELLI